MALRGHLDGLGRQVACEDVGEIDLVVAADCLRRVVSRGNAVRLKLVRKLVHGQTSVGPRRVVNALKAGDEQLRRHESVVLVGFENVANIGEQPSAQRSFCVATSLLSHHGETRCAGTCGPVPACEICDGHKGLPRVSRAVLNRHVRLHVGELVKVTHYPRVQPVTKVV